ncbi:gluconolaconase [Spirosoma sp. SC4-14]|uniref:gluconolaconase n=1 Tax=Spirosoma sp. SC4-14 TaxID=3128900 RepID=UPI0030CFA3E2
MDVFLKKVCGLFILAGSLTACNTPDPEFSAPVISERIAFSASRQYPEGITYSSQLDQFLVSSITQGKVGKVDLNGRYEDIIASDTSLISAIGIKVNNGKLYVCNSDQGVSTKSKPGTTLTTAGLFVYDLASGASVARYDLAKLYPNSKHFANDIAFDANGNAYVTDSFAPVIYKIPSDTTQPSALYSPLFAGTEGFNLNGIVYHPDNFLIVVKSNEGTLFKIDLNNTSILPKQILGPTLPNGDGMVFYNNDLYVVNNRNRVSRLRSTDNWNTFAIVETDSTGYNQATTNVAVNGRIYTLNARIEEVNKAVAAKNPSLLQASDYSIQQFKSSLSGN